MEEDSPEIDLTEDTDAQAELEELNENIAQITKKIHLTNVARVQLEEQLGPLEQKRAKLEHEGKALYNLRSKNS